ncbi:endosialin-like [Parambassis ranga]|uniref:Thrombomodulin n=1 Tax=Parambassis ranga TaxID=210632 RepID=A0A6P7HK16_9TELE|nr:endosialin-like [Parambassis ranga]
MACSQLAVFVPLKVKTVTVLMIFVLYIRRGFGIKQTGICRPFCAGSDCVTVNQDRVDFQTAQEACHDRNGDLLIFQSDTDENIIEILSQGLSGNFWIGLRLPTGTCSNLSAPLRGYEWTSAHKDRSFPPSFSTWKNSVILCSPHCVSLSNNRKWTERLCSEKIDGFLCKTKHKDACQAQELSDPVVYQSSKGCSTGPCEHICTDVKGGYTCSCSSGYMPDSRDLRQCVLHCAQEKCPAMCDRDTENSCHCPNGFLLTEKTCEDINECDMGECDQECKNTFGGFVCSCQEGFVLKDKYKCVKAEDSEGLVIPTPAEGFVKTADNSTQKVSSAPEGVFLWIWIVVVVVVVVFIFLIRLFVVKRQRRREQSPNQQSTAAAAPSDNIRC